MQLTTAGRGSSVYTSEQQGVNGLSDALFYLEREVKDLKLGRPLGLYMCTEGTCPDTAEAPSSGLSGAAIRQNLEGFRALLLGCDEGDFGFDDVLRQSSAGALADQLTTDLAAAVAAAAAVTAVRAAVTTNPEPALALHAAIKTLTDKLKSDLVTVLDLELPRRVEGDND
jgi:predicted lipoprotein